MTIDLVGARRYRYPPCVPGGTTMDVRFTLILSRQQNKPAEYCVKFQTETHQRVVRSRFTLSYCVGGAGNLRFPPIENPRVDIGISDCPSVLSIEDGGRRAGPDGCTLAEDAACCGAALGLA